MMQEHRNGPEMWEIAHMLWPNKVEFISVQFVKEGDFTNN